MTWAELEIPEAPETGNVDFDTWMSQTVKYLRDYLGAFHNRSDPSAYDFEVGDLTTDGTWQTGANALDLSSIVDADAKAVSFFCRIQDGSIAQYLQLRESGNSNAYSVGSLRTQVADNYISADFIVPYNSDQKVEYRGSNTAFTAIDIVVKGWWK